MKKKTTPKNDKIIIIKSKSQARRIAIQNPDLFQEVAEALGYKKVES